MAGGESELSSALAGRRILVVEDEYFLADDLVSALRSVGANVLGPIGETEAALAAVAGATTLDAAVLDINLRGDAIYPVAAALRSRQIPFVFATGYEKAKIPDEYGDVPRWEKPFDAAALAEALSHLLG